MMFLAGIFEGVALVWAPTAGITCGGIIAVIFAVFAVLEYRDNRRFDEKEKDIL